MRGGELMGLWAPFLGGNCLCGSLCSVGCQELGGSKKEGMTYEKSDDCGIAYGSLKESL